MTARSTSPSQGRCLPIRPLLLLALFVAVQFTAISPLTFAAAVPSATPTGQINIGTPDDPYYVADSQAIDALKASAFAPSPASVTSTVARIGSWTTGLTHTAGAGSNRLLIFSVGYENATDVGVSAVTYGGQALTRIGGIAVGSSSRVRAELWYLKETGIAAAGSTTFAVTWGGSAPTSPKYGAATYENVNQTTPIGHSIGSSSTSGSPNPLTTTLSVFAGGMAVSDIICGNTGSFTWNNSYVEGFDQSGSGCSMSAADRTEPATGSSIPSATHSNATRRAMFAASLVPDATTSSLDSLNISQIDPSQFPQICTYVEALDQYGNPIGGLTADSFCVSQDGNPVGGVTVSQLTLDSCRTATCLVIDVSGSMSSDGKMTAAKAAASQFVRNMDIYDRAAIVKFSTCYTVVQAFTGDTTLLLSAISGLSANGTTAYFDGVWAGVGLTVPELGSKAVIHLTDGMENASSGCGGAGTPDGLGDGFADDSALIVNLANGAGIPLYGITLGGGFDPQYVQKLSYATGGAYYNAPTGAQLDAIYDQIKTRLCTRYLICYNSPDTISNGDCHVVQICHHLGNGQCVDCDTLSYCEKAPPVIKRTPPTIALDNICQRWGNQVQLCAWVTDKDTPLSSLTVTLFYRNSSISPYTSVLTTRTDSTFCATVPASQLVCGGDSIQYYFTASDGALTVALPSNAPTGHFAFPICVNHPPVCSAPNDTTIALCSPGQICLPVSATDPDGNLQGCTKISGPGTLSGGQWCYTPAGSETVGVTVRCTDSCGLYCEKTFNVTFAVNSAPVCATLNDTTVFQCTPVEFCRPVSATDVDGNLTGCTVTSGPGTISGGNWCYTPIAEGTVTVTVRCTDACGAYCEKTFHVTFDFNDPPVCATLNDTTVFQCTPVEFCRPVSATDANGNLTGCTVVNGPGTISGGNWCYTPIAEGTVTVTVRCTDACGAYCEKTFHVTFDFNDPPVCATLNDTTVFQCTPVEYCRPITGTDPNGNLTGCTILVGPGAISGGNWCYTPVGDETVTVTIRCTDACGATCDRTFHVTFDINDAPVCNTLNDTTVFMCTPVQFCRPVSATDTDGNLTGCTVVNGPGTISGGNWCYTPVAEGTVTVTVRCTDACGAYCEKTFHVTFDFNDAPVCATLNDTTVFQCTPTQYCRPITGTDPNGNLTGCTIVNGPGTISGGNWCYTPLGDGTVTVTIRCTDACGLFCERTFHVTFDVNDAPVCGTINDTTYFQCAPAEVCRPVSATDVNGNLTGCTIVNGPGTLSGGNWCYTPSGDGTVTVTIRCTDACGAYCEKTFHVTFDINDAPVCGTINDTTVFQCQPTQLCRPVTSSDPNGNLVGCTVVSGPGTISGGNWCYTPSGDGTVTVTVRCTDACGAYCERTFNVTFNLNDPPQCSMQDITGSPPQCVPPLYAVQITSVDPEGGATNCVLYGPGDLNGNVYQYSPVGGETINVIIRCFDACGDSCEVAFSKTFPQHAPPVCNVPGDTAFFQCTPTEVCLPVSSASMNPPVTCSIVSGPGTLSGGNWCYTPAGDEMVSVTVRCTDVCGEFCEESFQITFTINDPPVISFGSDLWVYRTIPASQICVPYTVSDPNGLAHLLEQLVSGPSGAVIDTVNNKVCFTPPDTGTYTIIGQVTDSCGLTDVDTVVVHVSPSDPPVCQLPPDTTIFQCAATEVCLPVSATGAHLPITCTKIGGPGTLSGGNWCYTPVGGDGLVDVTIRCTDSLGVSCEGTFHVTFNLNDAPVCNVPHDTTIFQCAPAEVCLPVSATDPDGNLTGCAVLTGPGGVSGGNWCYTPSGDGSVAVTIRCTDACGAYCDKTFNVTFQINDPPVCSVPNDTTIFQCATAEICLPVSAVDPNGNFDNCTVVSGPGGIFDGEWCWTPGGDKTAASTVTIRCTDSCGLYCEATFDVNVIRNDPPVCDVPNDTTIFLCAASQVCLPVSATDVDGNLTECHLTAGSGTLSGGNWCYTPSGDETIGVTVVCTDACGAECESSFNVTFVINKAPVCNAISDTTYFLCAPAEICRPVSSTDVDGNLTGCAVVGGPGSVSGGNWCYTPSASGTSIVTIRCTDACGAYCEESFSVTVNINDGPQISCPPDNFYACPSEVPACNPSDVVIIGGSAPVVVTCSSTDNGGAGCPSNSLIITTTYLATDACGATAQCQRTTTVIDTIPPTLSGCPSDIAIQCGSPVPPPATVTASDNCGATISVGFTETPNMNGCGGNTGTITRRWTATDPCGNSRVCEQTITIQDTQAPVCNIPAGPFNYFQCTPTQILIPISATDNCDASVTCSVISGQGVVTGGNWQYTPVGDASFAVTIRCVDDCNNSCQSTFNVTVQVNDPPTVALGPDQQVFQCTPVQICVPYTTADPNGLNGSTEALIAVGAPLPGGTINTTSNQVCFTPPGAGTYCFAVEVTDSCGAKGRDTVCVTVSTNGAPTMTLQPDTAVFQCTPMPICVRYTVSDPNGNNLTESLVSGPPGATLNSGAKLICFTPASPGVYTIIAQATDPCGATDVDTMQVTVTSNNPPQLTVPDDTTIFQCSPAQVCLPLAGSDPDGGLVTITKTGGPGTVGGGQWCFTPGGDQTVTVTVRATDACGVYVEKSFTVTFNLNDPPQCVVPNDFTVRQNCVPQQVELPISILDPDNNGTTCQIVNGPGTIVNGHWVYTPLGSGQVCVTVQCSDQCGATCQKSFCVDFQIDEDLCNCLFVVALGDGDGTVEVLNGQEIVMPVRIDSVSGPIGGFDLLICYDQSVLTFLQASAGDALSGWEYFTYRHSPNSNCVGGCPSGYIRLLGIADLNNGVQVPPSAFTPIGDIADLVFQVSEDRNLIHQCVPITFCWLDCGDNTLSSKSGDTTWVDHLMVVDTCQSHAKTDPEPGICYSTGWICIMEPPDDRGDLNLNGFANEVGDIVLFTNYFVYGPSVWDPTWKDVQILASDINDDGVVLTVADLIYLIRILTGDASPFPPGGHPKMAPYAEAGAVSFETADHQIAVTSTSATDVGGMLLVFRYSGMSLGAPTLLEAASGMNMRYEAGNGELRVLLHPSWEGEPTATIGSGSHPILNIPISGDGSVELVEVQMADRDGALMSSNAAKSITPTSYALFQNYPNPFNAGTVMSFDLVTDASWSLTVYNITGQTVRTFEGRDGVGRVNVSWDGMDQSGNAMASGVYFYRFRANDFSATKKMLLVR